MEQVLSIGNNTFTNAQLQAIGKSTAKVILVYIWNPHQKLHFFTSGINAKRYAYSHIKSTT